MKIQANGAFDFQQSYQYMQRQNDCLYEVSGGKIRKAERLEGNKVLFEVTGRPDGVEVQILLNEGVSDEAVRKYVTEWLDLDYDVAGFYEWAEHDIRLKDHIKKLSGFRMTGYPDITDAFLWSVLGQQITMHFAYILKKRVIEYFNHHVIFEGNKYLMMPTAGEIASLSVEVLREMQVSTRKAEYIKNIMAEIDKGVLSKENLLKYQSYDDVLKFLTSFRGIGPWSANVVLMRCLKYRNAVPIGDAGLKNVLKITDDIEKPSVKYVEEEMRHYGGYGMYATVYLWEMLN